MLIISLEVAVWARFNSDFVFAEVFKIWFCVFYHSVLQNLIDVDVAFSYSCLWFFFNFFLKIQLPGNIQWSEYSYWFHVSSMCFSKLYWYKLFIRDIIAWPVSVVYKNVFALVFAVIGALVSLFLLIPFSEMISL